MSTKNLVVMPFGNASIESSWIFNNSNRNFDVILLFYHPSITNPKLLHPNSSFKIYELQDFKWVMIQKFFNQHPEYLVDYEYFFFPDDDIEIDLKTIHFLFKWTENYELSMSQPVLSRDSFKSWKVLRKKAVSGIRYLSSVELMCPLMSHQAVKELLPTFSLNKSGWGIDIVWGEMIRKKFGNKSIAVFDLLETKHTKPVGKGELYNKLGKSAFEERDEIFQKHQITKKKIYALSIRENNLLNRIASYFHLKKRFSYNS
jgi:Protein of unknown function (DUF707)